MKSGLTFITNEHGANLKERLKALIVPQTRLFDCLVGYFYLSGFHLLYPALESTEKIRILIGLKTDGRTFELLEEAKRQSSLQFVSHAEIKDQVEPNLRNEFEIDVEERGDIEEGIRKFLDWCASGKLEIKVYPSRKIHAKLYIMTFVESDRDKGRVITGSSNLSQSGLVDNLEFNVELHRPEDYNFALQKFNELWADAVEVTSEYVETIKHKSHLALFSPHEIYLKFLYEYFRTELSQPRELKQEYQPPGFKRLQYQQDAVLTAKRIAEEYGGVFLADVVGLGKTYMAAMLARELEGRSLVIAPPALVDEANPGAWGNVLYDFGVRGFKTFSVGRLDQILKLDLSKFQNVFIDEAHRFRNEDNETYEKLHRICKSKSPDGSAKRVILVTATPFNNRPNDLLSQLKLFQDSRNSSLPNLPNLDNFFRTLNNRLRPLNRIADREEYLRVMRENAREVRERVLKYLMVRRTRGEISRFYEEDLSAQELKFPDITSPVPVFYELSKRENEIFTRTIERITKQITYARYRPLTYYAGNLDENVKAAQFNLAGFMKVLLVKRLESSFEAFRLTLGRFIHAYDRFITSFKRGEVFVSKKKTTLIFDLIEAGDFEAIESIIEGGEAERYDAEEFTGEFLADLENDCRVLRAIRDDWEEIYRDPKWEKLRSLLQTDAVFTGSKLLLFTESKETAEYLSKRIADELNEPTLCFTGSSKKNLREEVILNFDARVQDKRDDFRILVTTDTLAEGVSLHRSNVVVNYDIPWNPTRMMQRVGRINRVDTEFDRLFTYNFFPSEEGNNEIGLREAAEAKIEAFIEMLGADARLLTENEEIKSFNLFARITAKETLTGEGEAPVDSELKYLQIIRDVQDNDSRLFDRIKRLPRKCRTARRATDYKNALLTYFRLGKLDKFYLSTIESPSVSELDFLAAVKILESNDTEKIPVNREFFTLAHRNRTALEHALQADHETVYAAASGRDAATRLMRRLHIFKHQDFLDFTEEEEKLWQSFLQALRDGAIAKKTVNRVTKDVGHIDTARGTLEIIKKNFSSNGITTEETPAPEPEAKPREVILSEYFI
jgi:superfamily II DNA or RNA helicase